jgi:hypothetical protein
VKSLARKWCLLLQGICETPKIEDRIHQKKRRRVVNVSNINLIDRWQCAMKETESKQKDVLIYPKRAHDGSDA